MVENIKGIVLRTVKYNDTSLIVDLFTQQHGRMSVMASTARVKRSVRSVSFWQPLSMVEFNADIRPQGKLPKPTDVHTYYNYIDLPFSPVKSSLVLFLAEFLSAATREERVNEPLYEYLEQSLQLLDMQECPLCIANFHLVFLIHLSHFIGIYPNIEDTGSYFDLMNGAYTYGQPPHPHYLKPEEARYLPVLFRMNYATMHLFRFSRAARMRILNVLNAYYRLHVPSFPTLKSLEVLHEMFD